jgi:putative ABC transport system permease protein
VVALAVAATYTGTERRAGRVRARGARLRPGATSRALLPAEIGVTFALLPGARRRALKRATVAGVVVAVSGVVASLLFVASLDAFTAAPARYGVPYDVTLEVAPDNARALLADLARDPNLDAVGALYAGTVEMEDQTVTAYSIEPVSRTVEPVVREGRLPKEGSEIAVGPKLLERLGRSVGDKVTVATTRTASALTVVGTVLAPVPESNDFNGEVVLSEAGFASYATSSYVQAVARVRPGADADAVLADLDARYPFAVSDESVPNAPGPVRNVEQIARLPLALALFFGVLGAAALSQALFVTARERRRDLAVLRSLGFTHAQSRSVLLSVAASVALVACAIGIPLGILLGRAGWNAVASNLFVAPAVVVPVAFILAAGAGVVLFALAVALVRARTANRLTTAVALRAE